MLRQEFRRRALRSDRCVGNVSAGADPCRRRYGARKRIFLIHCLYRSFLWPALRSDVNGEFTDADGEVVQYRVPLLHGPSYWDDYRNKLILLGLLAPECRGRRHQLGHRPGRKAGRIHADLLPRRPTLRRSWAECYLRGIRGFDVRRAYDWSCATPPCRGRSAVARRVCRPRLYPEMDVENPVTQTVCKAAVTKTLEYAYDDYAVALLADVLGDGANRDMLMKRTSNYKNLFDPSTGLMRGRLVRRLVDHALRRPVSLLRIQYREANACSRRSSRRTYRGLIGLYPSREAFGAQLDKLFSFRGRATMWTTLSGFIGSTATATSPTNSFPYLYYFIGRQERSQELLDHILDRSTAWDPKDWRCRAWTTPARCRRGMSSTPSGFTPIPRRSRIYRHRAAVRQGRSVAGRRFPLVDPPRGNGRRITGITCGGNPVGGWFVSHDALGKGELVIATPDK